MPADQLKKTKVFKRNFECQIMDKKNTIRSESVLNQNTVKVYTDGSKLDGIVGADLYAEYPNNSPKQTFFSPWNTHQCVPGRSLSYSKSGKEPAFGKMLNQSIVGLVDMQAAIKSLTNKVHCNFNYSAQLH